MSDTSSTPSSQPSSDPVVAPPAEAVPASPKVSRQGGVPPAAIGLLVILTLLALGLSWQAHERVQQLEQELVRRQQSTQGEANEARTLARQAQDVSRDSAAKLALVEARLAEVALQRSQLEELIQSLSRSRDENVLVDIEASIRVALQQSAITGSAEPLVATLRQADERLARYKQPRLEGVRRAVSRDLDRVKAINVVDVSSLTIKLDEAVRLIDELPLLSVAQRGKAEVDEAVASDRAPAKKRVAPAVAETGWWPELQTQWTSLAGKVWGEARTLLRVTRIDNPEAMLLAPEQAFFLRENLKLRLLNARLALLSRQFDTAQADLRDAQGGLERYFERNSRKVQAANELLRQVAGQARQVNVTRPDDTLAALSAAAAGR
nr:uroporphyrinogen-III C-methyltransferase [uncultured Roseateles sp.]